MNKRSKKTNYLTDTLPPRVTLYILNNIIKSAIGRTTAALVIIQTIWIYGRVYF